VAEAPVSQVEREVLTGAAYAIDNGLRPCHPLKTTPRARVVCHSSRMPELDFKYDVAFSFLQEDEGLATQINDRLQDRYRTFLYPKAQEQLAGTDGEMMFNAVFAKEARSVAVLLRDRWGIVGGPQSFH
jgi:hypothetical protein